MPPAPKVYVLTTFRSSMEVVTPDYRVHGVHSHREKAMAAAEGAARRVIGEVTEFPPSVEKLSNGYRAWAEFWTVIATVQEFDLTA